MPIKSVIVNYGDGSSSEFVPRVVQPPDPPAPPKYRTNVGVNLPAVRYWTSDRPFADLVKTMAPWTPCETTWGTGSLPPLNADGWPLQAMPKGYLAGVIDLKKGHPNADYRLDAFGYGGPANVRVAGQTGVFHKSADEMRVLIEVRSGLHDFSIYPQTGELARGPFMQSFLDSLADYNCLRFMNWNRTNDLDSVDWAKRTLQSNYTQADREVALEYQIKLCNQTGKPFWYNFHHTASDDFVRLVAMLVEQLLKPEIPIFVEYTNEAWNGQFKAYQHCLERSTASKNAMEYHLVRTAQIGQIFKTICPNGTRTVLGSFTFGHQTLEWVINRALLGNYVDQIDEVSIAPYFGHGVSESAKLQAAGGNLANVWAACESDITAVLIHVQSWASFAKRMGWTLNAYEFGQHLVPKPAERENKELVQAFVLANRHDRMYSLYKRFLTGWDQITGGALVNLFESVSLFDKFGCWGLQEYHGQPIEQTPKLRAVQDYIRRVF